MIATTKDTHEPISNCSWVKPSYISDSCTIHSPFVSIQQKQSFTYKHTWDDFFVSKFRILVAFICLKVFYVLLWLSTNFLNSRVQHVFRFVSFLHSDTKEHRNRSMWEIVQVFFPLFYHLFITCKIRVDQCTVNTIYASMLV